MLDGNALLAKLRSDDQQLIAPRLSLCTLQSGTVLFEPGDSASRCYFPRWDAAAIYRVALDDGESVEAAIIGREGAIGFVSQGQAPAFARCAVLHTGSFYRIDAADLENVRASSPGLNDLLARYAGCLVAQMFQSVACNAGHAIEQRAAKWLSAAADRIGARTVPMTQEELAAMLGVGRSYASRVLQKLKAEGLINTRRGGIEILDAPRLAAHACGCNAKVAEHYARVMDAPRAP